MKPIRLLLVDNEQASAEALAQRLEKLGYQVTRLGNDQEALHFLHVDRTIDVLLLDVQIPGPDGLETLRRLKTLQPLVEMVILTTDADVITAVEAIRIGAWDYCPKPCDLVRLTATITAAARHKRERERKILEIHMHPYITDSEKEELISSLLAR